MADTKITDLTALTGANLATGDDLALVDVSDTSMAASGTDKKITAGELKIGLATTLGMVGIDKIFDAAGDVVIGTGADASTRLAVSTTGGQALAADPNDTNKVTWQYPISAREVYRSTSGMLMASYDRYGSTNTNLAGPLTSGQLFLYGMPLVKGMSITNITFWSGTTALAAGVNQWFALFDGSRNKLLVTADDGATAWAANSSKTLALTGGPYVVTATGNFYVGIMIKATVPSLHGIVASDTVSYQAAAPLLAGGTTDTGLTNPASCPNPAGVITPGTKHPYFEVS